MILIQVVGFREKTIGVYITVISFLSFYMFFTLELFLELFDGLGFLLLNALKTPANLFDVLLLSHFYSLMFGGGGYRSHFIRPSYSVICTIFSRAKESHF